MVPRRPGIAADPARLVDGARGKRIAGEILHLRPHGGTGLSAARCRRQRWPEIWPADRLCAQHTRRRRTDPFAAALEERPGREGTVGRHELRRVPHQRDPPRRRGGAGRGRPRHDRFPDLHRGTRPRRRGDACRSGEVRPLRRRGTRCGGGPRQGPSARRAEEFRGVGGAGQGAQRSARPADLALWPWAARRGGAYFEQGGADQPGPGSVHRRRRRARQLSLFVEHCPARQGAVERLRTEPEVQAAKRRYRRRRRAGPQHRRGDRGVRRCQYQHALSRARWLCVERQRDQPRRDGGAGRQALASRLAGAFPSPTRPWPNAAEYCSRKNACRATRYWRPTIWTPISRRC